MAKSLSDYREALKLEREGGDPQKIVGLLRSAAKSGSPDASYALATFYLHGKYVEAAPETALIYLQEAAKKKHPAALFDMANALETGDIIERNLKKAFKFYLQSMIFGDKDAINEVARCFYYGIGTSRNRALYEIFTETNEWVKNKDKR